MHGLLVAVASIVAEQGLEGVQASLTGVWARELQLPGSGAWAHRHTGLVVPWHVGSSQIGD